MSSADRAFDVIETAWIELPGRPRFAARLWLPADALAEPVPAVFEFLPYRRRDSTSARDESTYPAFARAGYAGVRVDMRGTGDSDGLYDDEYSETELADAQAIIGWIAEQPWCSGAVGMMGISWGGFNALQVAARRPPALKAVISIASSVDRYNDDIHYRNGCHLGAHLNWAATVLGYMARPPDSDVVG
ncbi:MAG TPA: CocE/NonD family hydrolase, partial [Ilumatobacteraceae bacterium]|nr:CocE/NonD family hydrolase [Ilumatobacteraceae bacterium]